MRLFAIGALLFLAIPSIVVTQERPNFTGEWTFAPELQAPGAKPPGGYGSKITIWHEGGRLTATVAFPAGSVPVTYVLDGSETRTRVPGGLCQGDTTSVWTATWQDNTIVTTMIGSVPPGATTVTKRDVKAMFKLQSADVMTVTMVVPTGEGKEPRTTTGLYKKAGVPAGQPPQPVPAPLPARISQIEWLGGTWIGTTSTSSSEERWTPPAGGSMLAVARSLRSGVMNSFEFLCIVERHGGLVYTAMPNGRQPATDFTLTKIESNSVTFENPSHDFPKMIRYTLGADGTLEAVVSGTEKQKPQIFKFKKQPSSP